MLKLGINNSALKQITASDSIESNGQVQVYAISPAALFSFSPETHLFLKAYYEFDTDNRPEEECYTILPVHHF